MQIPPKFSAKKINGQSAYKLARKGKEINLKPCRVQIKKIELIKQVDDEITFKVLVSKGTYIRSLCEQIAKLSNNLGTMNSLIRTKVGDLKIEDSSFINNIMDHSLKNILDVITLPKVKLKKEEFDKIILGQRFFLKNQGLIALTYKKQLVSVVENKEKMKIIRNFNESS